MGPGESTEPKLRDPVGETEGDVAGTGTYRDASLPVEQRVEDLLRRMTLDEKVGQMNQRLFGWQCFERDGDAIELTSVLRDEAKHWGGIGAVYGFLRADPWSGVTVETGIPVARRVETLNRAQEAILASSRLRLPAFFSAEAPHGHMAVGGTILPTAIGVGSTWNPALYREAAAAVAAEVRSSGEHLALVSSLDIARDPRWGRTEECFGEDPVLAAEMNRAVTLGTQGENPGDLAAPERAVAVSSVSLVKAPSSVGTTAARPTSGRASSARFTYRLPRPASAPERSAS